MVTLEQIAERYNLSLQYVRERSRGRDFPPPAKIGGKTGRLKLYRMSDVALWRRPPKRKAR